jgi:integrase
LTGYSKSIVDHLRFDLNAICRLAVTDGLARNNQAEARVLFAPRGCARPDKPVMSAEQVRLALSVLDLRERAFCRLAIFAGMRPGEIIALRWDGIEDAVAKIDKRIYKGEIDDPKNNKPRDAALSSSVVDDLQLWKQFALPSPYVFASETTLTPIKYENLWQRHIKPRFAKVGLEWADFRCMRRTNGSLMKAAHGDDKVAADQRGHNVNTSVNEYQQSTKAQKAKAVDLLERSLVQ